jgi:cell division cycle protein 20 (cofactor of APC complex)
LSTHGPGAAIAAGTDSQTWPIRNSTVNSLALHSFPSLRNVMTESAASKGLGDSVLSPTGTKVVFSVPEENSLKVWDVWGKRKEVKRQPSFLDSLTSIR